MEESCCFLQLKLWAAARNEHRTRQTSPATCQLWDLQKNDFTSLSLGCFSVNENNKFIFELLIESDKIKSKKVSSQPLKHWRIPEVHVKWGKQRGGRE